MKNQTQLEKAQNSLQQLKKKYSFNRNQLKQSLEFQDNEFIQNDNCIAVIPKKVEKHNYPQIDEKIYTTQRHSSQSRNLSPLSQDQQKRNSNLNVETKSGRKKSIGKVDISLPKNDQQIFNLVGQNRNIKVHTKLFKNRPKLQESQKQESLYVSRKDSVQQNNSSQNRSNSKQSLDRPANIKQQQCQQEEEQVKQIESQGNSILTKSVNKPPIIKRIIFQNDKKQPSLVKDFVCNLFQKQIVSPSNSSKQNSSISMNCTQMTVNKQNSNQQIQFTPKSKQVRKQLFYFVVCLFIFFLSTNKVQRRQIQTRQLIKGRSLDHKQKENSSISPIEKDTSNTIGSQSNISKQTNNKITTPKNNKFNDQNNSIEINNEQKQNSKHQRNSKGFIRVSEKQQINQIQEKINQQTNEIEIIKQNLQQKLQQIEDQNKSVNEVFELNNQIKVKNQEKPIKFKKTERKNNTKQTKQETDKSNNSIIQIIQQQNNKFNTEEQPKQKYSKKKEENNQKQTENNIFVNNSQAKNDSPSTQNNTPTYKYNSYTAENNIITNQNESNEKNDTIFDSEDSVHLDKANEIDINTFTFQKLNKNFLKYQQNEQNNENQVKKNPIEESEQIHSKQNINDEQSFLIECREGCGRKFNEIAIQTHEKICQKVFQQKRKVFNSSQKRIIDSEHKKILQNSKNEESEQKKSEKKKAKWKIQSEQFRAVISHKQDKEAIKQAFEQNDYIQCPICERKFNEDAGKRHIAFCERKSKENKSKQKN